MESETKNCQNCKKDFVIEQEDFNFYEKINVPAPTFCPMCRAERRLTFRNERKLFRVKDAFTGEEIFSLYPTESGRKVVTQEEWNGDSWDAMEYSRNFNLSIPFLKQVLELEKQIPIFNLNVKFRVNSLYSGNATSIKNCFLCFNLNDSENCMYGNAMDYCKDCVDNSHINHSERCYECFWLQNCYQCYFTIMSVESHNLWFCRDCLGCDDCFGCTNLRKSSYCIFNQKYAREVYFEKIKQMKLNTISGILKAREKARKFWKTQPTKCHQGLKNLNSTGSYVTNCKNVNDSYLIREGENMRYCQYLLIKGNKECYDATLWGKNMELLYETCTTGGNSYNIKFSFDLWSHCKNIEYSISMVNCSNCFGCVGLKKKQYCVLNKQYTKNEYEVLVENIKEHMNKMPFIDKKGRTYRYGEFFPIEFSPFGYNNTSAIQHFEMTKERAEENGYPWIEIPHGEYTITKKASELPDSINEVSEEILKEVIECENCKNAYRILENELIFYKKENLPLPTMCDECRFKRRIQDRLKIQLYERECMCAGNEDETGVYKNTAKHVHGDEPCGEEFKTGYSPDGKEIVYCEKCYQQEVY